MTRWVSRAAAAAVSVLAPASGNEMIHSGCISMQLPVGSSTAATRFAFDPNDSVDLQIGRMPRGMFYAKSAPVDYSGA